MFDQYPFLQGDELLQGLATDMMEDKKAFEWMVVAMDLITGLRPRDLIYELLNSGRNLDSALIAKVLYLDQMVNIAAAEVIQTLVQYRAHSSQKNRIIEAIISGKRYEGPIYNDVVRQAKYVSNDCVRKILLDLVKINSAAIETVMGYCMI